MLVFRSLAIGLLSACFVLLIMRPAVEVRMAPRWAPRWADNVSRGFVPRPVAVPTIIDVAPGVSAAQLATMIRLAPGEHVASIDDAPVSGDVGAGVALGTLDLRARHFIDLGVASDVGERRVLVLLH
jgi:hypothetical protein